MRHNPRMPSVMEQFEQAIQAAASAIQSGDADAALRQARAAQVLLAAIPDGGREGSQASWGRQMLPQIIADAKQMKAASMGMRDTRITYGREPRTTTPSVGEFG